LLATKAVRQRYHASPDLLRLLDEFRRMVNVCVMMGIEQNISSLKTLASRTYPSLSRDILSYYRLGAISTATGIIHNYRKAKNKSPLTKRHAQEN
jgi:putative transposase